ncbi:MAG: hypothetical protein QMD95_05125, partial [Candidatus Hodarchaeaceae archaeon]|nr:hypothetical protein [Candidatus Hodarchaeaceae archaeon]
FGTCTWFDGIIRNKILQVARTTGFFIVVSVIHNYRNGARRVRRPCERKGRRASLYASISREEHERKLRRMVLIVSSTHLFVSKNCRMEVGTIKLPSFMR